MRWPGKKKRNNSVPLDSSTASFSSASVSSLSTTAAPLNNSPIGMDSMQSKNSNSGTSHDPDRGDDPAALPSRVQQPTAEEAHAQAQHISTTAQASLQAPQTPHSSQESQVSPSPESQYGNSEEPLEKRFPEKPHLGSSPQQNQTFAETPITSPSLNRTPSPTSKTSPFSHSKRHSISISSSASAAMKIKRQGIPPQPFTTIQQHRKSSSLESSLAALSLSQQLADVPSSPGAVGSSSYPVIVPPVTSEPAAPPHSSPDHVLQESGTFPGQTHSNSGPPVIDFDFDRSDQRDQGKKKENQQQPPNQLRSTSISSNLSFSPTLASIDLAINIPRPHSPTTNSRSLETSSSPPKRNGFSPNFGSKSQDALHSAFANPSRSPVPSNSEKLRAHEAPITGSPHFQLVQQSM